MYSPSRDEFIPCEPELKHMVIAFGECSRVLQFFSEVQREIADKWEDSTIDLKLMEREGITFIRFEFEESWGNRLTDRAAMLRQFPDIGCAIATEYENNGVRRLVSHRALGGYFARGLVENSPRYTNGNDKDDRDIFVGDWLICDLMKNRNMEIAYGMLGYYLDELKLIEPYYYTG